MELAIQIATLFGVLLTFVSVLLTFFGMLAAVAALLSTYDIFRKQGQINVFLAYTERFAKLMANWPREAWTHRFDQSNLPPESKELQCGVLEYLNICSEEYYLYKNRLIARKVWEIWEDEIRRTLASPLFQREWPKLRQEYRCFPEFIRYVEQAQADRALCDSVVTIAINSEEAPQ